MKGNGLIWSGLQSTIFRVSPSYDVSKRMTALLRHGTTILREEDGAVEFFRLKAEFKSKFPNSVRWSDRLCVDHFTRGGGTNKRFQFCTNRTGTVILYFRAIQGHSGETFVDPSLLDKVLIPNNFFEFIYHVGSYLNMHSIIASGLIAGGRIHGRDRQTEFVTAVDPWTKTW